MKMQLAHRLRCSIKKLFFFTVGAFVLVWLLSSFSVNKQAAGIEKLNEPLRYSVSDDIKKSGTPDDRKKEQIAAHQKRANSVDDQVKSINDMKSIRRIISANENTDLEGENIAMEMLDVPKEESSNSSILLVDENVAMEEDSGENLAEKPVDNSFLPRIIDIFSKEKSKKKELEEQEASFHELPKFSLDVSPQAELSKVNVDNLWIRNINSRVKPETLNVIGNSSKSRNLFQVVKPEKEVSNFAMLASKKSTFAKEQDESFHQLPDDQKENQNENWSNISQSEADRLSVLGARLFLGDQTGQEQKRNFTIHVWKHLKYISRRLIKDPER